MDQLVQNNDGSIEMQYKETFEALEMKNHFHNSNEIIYIAEGKAEFKINEKVYRVGKGDIIFISNLENHELKVVEYPYKRYFILIKPDQFQLLISHPVLASIFKHRPEHFQHVVSLGSQESNPMQDLIQKMCHEYSHQEAFWESNLGSYLSTFFVLLYRNFPQYFPISSLDASTHMVLDIQRYIEQHFTEDISLSEVSKMFYSNMYYISHLFKKITGFSFKEYIILLRIAKAKDLLFYSQDSITAVSLNTGFNSVNHFIRIFKKFEGITPYQFRKMRME